MNVDGWEFSNKVSSDDRCRKNRLHARAWLGVGWGPIMTFNPADEIQCFDVGGTLTRKRFGFINSASTGSSSQDLHDSWTSGLVSSSLLLSLFFQSRSSAPTWTATATERSTTRWRSFAAATASAVSSQTPKSPPCAASTRRPAKRRRTSPTYLRSRLPTPAYCGSLERTRTDRGCCAHRCAPPRPCSSLPKAIMRPSRVSQRVPLTGLHTGGRSCVSCDMVHLSLMTQMSKCTYWLQQQKRISLCNVTNTFKSPWVRGVDSMFKDCLVCDSDVYM